MGLDLLISVTGHTVTHFDVFSPCKTATTKFLLFEIDIPLETPDEFWCQNESSTKMEGYFKKIDQQTRRILTS
ncbi:hypothetical protein AcV5_007818 [Taiwanofungus camphoratus]|nr:hypothetical protein AcV5_007818 [Antrodia cinnamomea]